MQTKIINNGLEKLYCLELSEEITLDNYIYKILLEKPKATLSCYLESEKPLSLHYKIANLSSLTSILKESYDFEEFCELLEQMIEFQINLANYLIAPNQILFNADAIFYNAVNKQLNFIILPTKAQNNLPDFKQFLQQLLKKFKLDGISRFSFNQLYSYICSDEFYLMGLKTLLAEIKQNNKKLNFSKQELHQQLPSAIKINTENNDVNSENLCYKNYNKNKKNVYKSRANKLQISNKNKGFVKISLVLVQILVLLIYSLIYFRAPLITAESFKLRLGSAIILFSVDIIFLKFLANRTLIANQYSKKSKRKLNKASICQKTTYANTEVLGGTECPYLLDQKTGFVFKLEKPEILIGRDLSAVDYCLDKATVGRKHCKITRFHNQTLLSDLLSINGTFVNDIKLASEAQIELQHGDRICIADVNLQYFAY